MKTSPNIFFILAASLNALAALIHLACIVFGGSWYRFFGAGEGIARLADAGHWYPPVFAASVAGLLFIWSLYALSGAGVVRRLPLLKFSLCLISAIYVVRGLAFVMLMPYFPGNSLTFWLLSSAICLSLGLVHLAGLRQAWARL